MFPRNFEATMAKAEERTKTNAGKTTLLRMLAVQLEPDSGEIRTAGV